MVVRLSSCLAFLRRRPASQRLLDHLSTTFPAAVSSGGLGSLYGDLLASGNLKTWTGLSDKTVRYVHTIIHTVFGDAVDLALVHVNVANRAKPPRPRAKEAKADQVMDRRRAPAVSRHSRWTPSRSDLAPGCVTGMRRAEILGLRWRDLDLDSGRLSVRQTLVSVGYEIVKSTPKTRQARTIDLDPATVRRLLQAPRTAASRPPEMGIGLPGRRPGLLPGR